MHPKPKLGVWCSSVVSCSYSWPFPHKRFTGGWGTRPSRPRLGDICRGRCTSSYYIAKFYLHLYFAILSIFNVISHLPKVSFPGNIEGRPGPVWTPDTLDSGKQTPVNTRLWQRHSWQLPRQSNCSIQPCRWLCSERGVGQGLKYCRATLQGRAECFCAGLSQTTTL